MIKNINSIFFMLFIGMTAFFISCSNEEYRQLSQNPTDDNIMLQLVINKDDMTRGMITSSQFQNGDSVLVILTDRQDPDNMTLVTSAVYRGGNWVIDPNNSINFAEKTPEGTQWTTVDVCVYYPYKLAMKGFDKTSRTVLINDLVSQTDILYGACQGLTKNNPVANITCHHAMTCLTFALKNNSSYGAYIEKLEMEPGRSQFLGYAGTLTSEGLENIKYDYSGQIPYTSVIPAGATLNIDFLLAPTVEAYQNMLDEETQSDRWAIILTVNGVKINFYIDLSIWNAGTQYIYPVNLPSDLPERKPNKIHMYDTWDNKQVYFADINVGACSISDYGRLFGWGDPSGNRTSENLADYPSASPPKDIAGTGYDIAKVNWGEKWQMPTVNDIWGLSTYAESEEWVEINGVYGVKITSKQTGNSIFLPTAPQRVGSSITQNGFYTQYWLSDINDEDSQKAATIYINYNATYENPISFWPSKGTFRYTGLPVRAIWIEE